MATKIKRANKYKIIQDKWKSTGVCITKYYVSYAFETAKLTCKI